MSNLLPHKIQKEVFDRMIMRHTVAATIILSFLAVVGVASLFPAYFTWDSRAGALLYSTEALENVTGDGQRMLRSDVVATNRRIIIIDGLLNRDKYPSDAIAIIMDSIPAGASIERIEYTSPQVTSDDTSKLSVSSIITNKADQEAFLSELRKHPLFSQVNIPISALTQSDEDAITVELLGIF